VVTIGVAQPSVPARNPGGVDRGAAGGYVLGRRTPDGGFSFYRTPSWGVEEPNAPDTLAALESLRLLFLEVPAPHETVGWLRSLQDGDGSFATLTIGWAALRALGVLGVAPSRSPLAWLGEVAGRAARPDVARSWRSAIVDASRLLELGELLSSPIPAASSLVERLLDDADDPDGGWARPELDLETFAIADRLAGLAGLDGADRDRAARYVRTCEDPVFGFRLSPSAAATSVGALRGGLWLLRSTGLAGRHLDAARRQLVMLQGPDGGFAARHRALSTLQDTWRGLDAARLLDELQEAS
jgi:hypothetical protein